MKLWAPQTKLWIPHLGAQTEFLQRNEFEVLFGGATGPGKTDCLIAAMTRHIENPRYRGLILRRTTPQMREIRDRCHELYPAFGGIYLSGDKRWTFPSGARITLGHMNNEDDKYNYHGHQFHVVGFDELTQFLESQYIYIFSRVRTIDPEIPCRVLSTSNPGNIGHNWVKERFQPGERDGKTYYDKRTGLSRVFIPATVEDNPTLFENDPDYVKRLESQSEIEVKRYRHGVWDAFEGQIFTDLLQSLHGYEDFDIPPEWERYCVFDWGFAKPFSVGWYAVDYDGIIFRYREWYGSKHAEDSSGYNQGLRMQAWEVARGILEREREAGEKIRRRVADPSIWGKRPEFRRKEARGPTINDDFVQEGVYFTKGDNDRIAGKQQVHKRLKPEIEVDEETGEIISQRAMLMVANSCKHFWRTFPLLQEDKKNPDDVDTKQEDHIYDEVRYMCMARPLRPKKVVTIPAGSFQAERARYIRAKKYAKRHGLSMPEAYTRVR